MACVMSKPPHMTTMHCCPVRSMPQAMCFLRQQQQRCINSSVYGYISACTTCNEHVKEDAQDHGSGLKLNVLLLPSFHHITSHHTARHSTAQHSNTVLSHRCCCWAARRRAARSAPAAPRPSTSARCRSAPCSLRGPAGCAGTYPHVTPPAARRRRHAGRAVDDMPA
jgi:hypothetical protein